MKDKEKAHVAEMLADKTVRDGGRGVGRASSGSRVSTCKWHGGLCENRNTGLGKSEKRMPCSRLCL